jgi:hypothetical protein
VVSDLRGIKLMVDLVAFLYALRRDVVSDLPGSSPFGWYTAFLYALRRDVVSDARGSGSAVYGGAAR